jgi:Flp pilus assembly protein TadD
MAAAASTGAAGNARLAFNTLIVVGAGLLLAACSQAGSLSDHLAGGPSPPTQTGSTAAAPDNRSELQKATEYWGKELAKNPRDAQTALNYARNLKALGEKRQALAVLQQASMFNGAHRGINAEYGRLALEFDQVSLAAKLLEQADDPANPDWKLISARGTVLAKQGRYRDAIPFYERALALAPDQASILNNLALAHAMEGHPDKAEPLLKRAAAAGGHEARVGQNLALVLGLQGKYDEAKLTAARDLPADNAAANVDYVRSIVKLQPQPLAKATPEPAPELKGPVAGDSEAGAPSAWAPQVVASKPSRREPVQTAR